jgi:hypothetical protein
MKALGSIDAEVIEEVAPDPPPAHRPTVNRRGLLGPRR